MDLNQFLGIIRNMDRRPFKPHRYLALMAIIDIIENQENQNKFYHNDDLRNYFTHYFDSYRRPNDQDRPFLPFFYLKNAGDDAGGFWFLKPKLGKGSELNSLGRIDGPGQLNEIVEYAELDREIFNILSDKESGQESREIVRKEIEKCLKAGLQINL